jgi:hypothetical protein
VWSRARTKSSGSTLSAASEYTAGTLFFCGLDSCCDG